MRAVIQRVQRAAVVVEGVVVGEITEPGLFVLVGAQFLGMGLLGEYIGRIYKNVGARPRYLIHQIHGESPIP